jgi:predicted flap endonuclease-1-like 5' DNA nuclease
MTKKYMLNPDYHTDRVRCNGITITSDDILEGDEWFEGTKQPFENIPPLLVVAPEDAEVTISMEDEALAPQHPSIEEIASRAGVASVPDTDPEDDEKDEEEDGPQGEEREDDPEEPNLDPDEEEEEEEEEDDPEENDLGPDLTDISGVGDSRADMIVEAGYEDVVAVAKATGEELMKAVRDLGKPLNLATARSIVKGAKDLLEE